MVFKKRAKKPGQPFATPMSTNNPYNAFRYNADSMLSFQCSHPNYQGYTTWYSLGEGGTVSVVTPYSSPDALKFRLSELPFEQWIQLSDHQKRPVPLALYVDVGGPMGKWLT